MKAAVFIIATLALSNFSLVAQETSPSPTAAKALPPDLPVTSTVMRTNSMTVLDDKKRLGSNDYVSFRVVEDRDDESQHLRVSEKSRGRIYVYGSVKGQGPQEIPADESYTVSKAIIRAGGFGDFANKRK